MIIAIDIRNIGKQKTGSEVVVRDLTKHLLQRDRSNTYQLLTDTADPAVLAQVHEQLDLEGKDNATVVSLPTANKFLWALWTVQRYARRQHIDVYHTEYILPFFMPRTVQLVTHIHDVSFRVYRKLISWKDIFFLDLLIPWSLRRADAIAAVSQFTKDEILKYYNVPAAKVHVVYNAIDSDQRPTTSDQRQDVMHKYKLPQKYILAVGTMQPRKNIPFLIKAYAQALTQFQANNDASAAFPHLVLMGKRGHNFDTTIDATIARHPELAERILFTGYVDEADKVAVFAGAELFVYPSLYEGFGVPILEALAAGTAVLASDIPPHREAGGEAVVFADPEDRDNFAAALATLCSHADHRAALLAAAPAQVQQFSWDHSAEALLAIFTKIAQKRA